MCRERLEAVGHAALCPDLPSLCELGEIKGDQWVSLNDYKLDKTQIFHEMRLT